MMCRELESEQHATMTCSFDDNIGYIHPKGDDLENDHFPREKLAASLDKKRQRWLNVYREDPLLGKWGCPHKPASPYHKRCKQLEETPYGPMRCTNGIVHPVGEYDEAKAAKDNEASGNWNHHNWWHYKYGQDWQLRSWGSKDDPNS